MRIGIGMLDRATLIARFDTGEMFSFLFFWVLTVPKDGGVGRTCLSQLYPSEFKIDGVFVPNDGTLDDGVEGLAVWRRDDTGPGRLVTEVNVAKFGQNAGLRDFLVATGLARQRPDGRNAGFERTGAQTQWCRECNVAELAKPFATLVPFRVQYNFLPCQRNAAPADASVDRWEYGIDKLTMQSATRDLLK
jgi:hypothetical protein